MAKPIKITEEVINQWTEALRSDEYTQCRGRLHDKKDGGYCCLGVLLKECFDYTPSYLGRGKNEEDQPASHLYHEIDLQLKAAGIYRITVSDLTNMNDSKKFPFDMIADRIEREWSMRGEGGIARFKEESNG